MALTEDGKFRISIIGNIGIIASIFVTGIALWTTLVQKYDEVTAKLNVLNQEVKTVEDQKSHIDDLSKALDAQGAHMLADEAREATLEGKVDALTTLLNQFIATQTRQQQLPNPPSRRGGY